MYMKCLNHQMTSDNQSKQELSTCLESPCTNNYTMEIIVTSVACFMLLFPLLDSCLVEVDWIVLIILDCYWESFLNMVLEFLATLYIHVQSFCASDRSTTWAANGIYLFLLLKLPYFAIIEKMISLNVNIIITWTWFYPSRNKLTKMHKVQL